MFASPYEFVAHSMHGKKKTGLLRNRFKFLSNPYDVCIYSTCGRKILVAPDLIEQPVAAHRLSGVTQKMLQQFKLRARKFHRLAGTKDLVTAQIDLDITEAVAVLLLR